MRKILIIDDDEIVARSLQRFVSLSLPDGWTVEYELVAKAGLERLVFDQDVAICLLDVWMPKFSGVSVVEHALRKRPGLRGLIVICSGAVLTHWEEQRLFRDLGCECLSKPPSLDALEEMIRRLIARASS